jgi:hypothetical protein
MEKDPAIYVRHILEAIANIETDASVQSSPASRMRRGSRR